MKRPPQAPSTNGGANGTVVSSSLGCDHIKSALRRSESEILKNYKLAVKLALNINIKADEPTAVSLQVLKCSNCPSYTRSSSLVCLECAYVGCISHGRKIHASATGHCLGMDLANEETLIYCHGCQDFIYSDLFEKLRIKTLHECFGGVPNTNSGGDKDCPELRMSQQELADLTSLPSFQATTGLKGFYNMGATCYISVVLQSLIHNPLVRNFFLAGGHDRLICSNGNPGDCMSCFIDEMFCNFFSSNNIQGYGVTKLLELVWRHKRSFSGASEQDAHEFLQFLLNEIHSTHFESRVFNGMRDLEGTTNSEQLNSQQQQHQHQFASDDATCTCVAHTTFYGQLESRIKCTNCQVNITKTVDPMMDLSLEIKRLQKQQKSHITLQDCLNMFTSPETLDILYDCFNCNSKHTVEKQLFIKRLPNVLSIQLKRFNVSGGGSGNGGGNGSGVNGDSGSWASGGNGSQSISGNSNTNKIETQVKFPLFLDMSKYTTAGHDSASQPSSPVVYTLFGILCHQGSLNTGHYTCMMKNRNEQWFNFDDSMVTKVTVNQVLNANAYLLFYIISDCPHD